jgi:hypothetical protein
VENLGSRDSGVVRLRLTGSVRQRSPARRRQGDSFTPPACIVELAAIGCPESYGAALSSAGAECGTVDNPRIGVCGGLRVYRFGHDGTTICAYDSSTDALAGGVSSGIPLPSITDFALCGLYFTAGQVVPDSCRDPVTSACATDAGAD